MAYLLRHQIGTWALIYSIFASCSGNDNRSDYPHKGDSKLVSEVKTNPGSLCDAMEWLFSQKCVRETSKLTSSNQEVNTVLVQEDNELICIEIISEGVEIVFKPTSLTLDAFRESPYKKEKGVKYFYLSQVIDNDNSGVIEIIYPYSGNIYKLTATKQESAWVNIDFFCANY
ncbi:MAG TPA: hypothetical protein PKA00_03720 [Saprospiraceae bacterium]|nr:hypothetical protein [Saprospiraceae bacterium]HMQ81985.1 hypothetical protein [Saprospiraceae bacterium]